MNIYKKNLNQLKQNFVYNETMEHDACGVGLVASTEGVKSRKVVEYGIQALKAVWHRGAIVQTVKLVMEQGYILRFQKIFSSKKLK